MTVIPPPAAGTSECEAGCRRATTGGGAEVRSVPAALEAGVYTARPLLSLDRAVHEALGAPSRDELEENADLSRVWERPRLHARLVRVLAEDAARVGAPRIEVVDRGSLALAAPVALRLGVALDGAGSSGGDSLEPEATPRGSAQERPVRTYLVAWLLRDSEIERLRAGDGGREPPVGIGTVVRLRKEGSDRSETDNIMSIMDL